MGLWSLTLYKGVQHYMLNKIQNKIRNTETRLKLSIFAGVLAVFLSGSPVNMQKTMDGGEPFILNFVLRETDPRKNSRKNMKDQRFPSGLRKCWIGDKM